MNLRHLETFVIIAETGSFQTAADRMHVTQSAVSMQMKALEVDLGTALFDRSRRPPALSPSGRSLIDPARALLDAAADFREKAQGGAGLFGTLKLGAIPTATTGILPGALARLQEDHPKLQIRLESGLSLGLEERVASGDLDAAVITLAGRQRPGLDILPIRTERLVVVAKASICGVGAGGEAVLERLPFIRFNKATGIGKVIEQQLQRLQINVRETMELDSIEAILEMVTQGLGAAVVPESSLRPDETLSKLTLGDPPLTRDVALIVRKGARKFPLTNELWQALKASI
ncbi:MAG: LysR family transcriptional regulator [Alphaproteobacteria bacterium]